MSWDPKEGGSQLGELPFCTGTFVVAFARLMDKNVPCSGRREIDRPFSFFFFFFFYKYFINSLAEEAMES